MLALRPKRLSASLIQTLASIASLFSRPSFKRAYTVVSCAFHWRSSACWPLLSLSLGAIGRPWPTMRLALTAIDESHHWPTLSSAPLITFQRWSDLTVLSKHDLPKIILWTQWKLGLLIAGKRASLLGWARHMSKTACTDSYAFLLTKWESYC